MSVQNFPAPCQALKCARILTVMIAVMSGLMILRLGFCVTIPDGLYNKDIYFDSLKAVFITIPFIFFAYYYFKQRRDLIAALALMIPPCFVLNWIFAFEINYTIFYVGKDYRLIDADLAAWDTALSFDWPAYFHWVVSRPITNGVLACAYQSIWWQSFALIGVFSVKKRMWDFACLQIALPLSFGLTCFVATFLPAIGAYHFHGMTPTGHPGIAISFTDRAAESLLWLRQTELPAVMPNFTELRLISFPSWHAAVAVIFMLSAWSVPVLRWLSLALNVLMLAATPVQGAHYISDMIVGAGIGGIAFAISAWALRSATTGLESRAQSNDLDLWIVRGHRRARIVPAGTRSDDP